MALPLPQGGSTFLLSEIESSPIPEGSGGAQTFLSVPARFRALFKAAFEPQRHNGTTDTTDTTYESLEFLVIPLLVLRGLGALCG